MLAWMGYVTLVGAFLVVAGALLEHSAPWLVGKCRMIWLAVITGTLTLAIYTLVPTASRAVHAPNTERAIESAPIATAPVDPRSVAPLPSEPPSIASATTDTTSDTSLDLDVLLAFVWLLGSTMCLGVLVASAWRVSRMRQAWRETVIAGVPVLVSHDVGPAVIGLVHHGIVVPSWVEALDDDEQRTVMTHEREHVRAGDPLLLWGTTLLVVLMPWNAALWYALRRLRHAIEMDCDARVLRSRPDARAYCTLLVDVGERTLAGLAPMAALAEPATLLERRIEALTAPARGWNRRVALGALAALMLIVAACWAPRPVVAPRARLVALVSEINSLLARDSNEHFLTVAERAAAARTLARSDTLVVPGAPDSTLLWESKLVPKMDDALRLVFPQLFTRTDTTEMMALLTYDYTGKLKGHSIRPMPRWRAYGAPDFSNVQIKLFGMRDRPELHATLVYIVEKWDVANEPARSAYGGLHGPAVSKNVPAAKQYGHRVDSLARVNYPEAYGPRDDAIVVTVLFDVRGRIVRSLAKRFPVDQVFDVIPGVTNAALSTRSSSYLLSRTLGAEVPKLTQSGSQTMRDAPEAIFVFGELAPDAQTQRDLSPDSLLRLSSRYESTTVHGISSGTSFVALRLDRYGAVIAHSNVGYGPNMTRPSITAMRQSIFGIDSTKDDDVARIVLLRPGEPDAMPGPLYVLVVRPRG